MKIAQMAKKSLEELQSTITDYDTASQEMIKAFVLRRNEIGKFKDLNNNSGWKTLEKKIHEDIKERIIEKTKNDPVIKSLLSILQATQTKKQSELLEMEIEQILGE